MRVLHLIDTFGPGGAETVMLRLVQNLDPGGWASTAVVTGRGWLTDALAEAGIEYHVAPSTRSFDVGWITALVRLARRQRSQLLQTHLFGSAVYGSAVGRLLGIPVISTIHGQIDVPERDRWIAAKAALIAHPRNRLVAVTEELRQRLIGRFRLPPGRVRLITNGIDTDGVLREPPASLRAEHGWSASELVLGAVGNVRAPKDYANLIRAAKLVRDRGIACRVVIVGDTEGQPELHRELLALRRELELDQHVVFTGFRRDVEAVLKAVDMYVLSSVREGLPLALLQAMAARVPIVATRCGGPQEVLVDGGEGVLVPPQDPAALADAIQQLADRPALARQLAEAAREKVLRLYDMRSMVGQYQALYHEALGSVPPARRPAARVGLG